MSRRIQTAAVQRWIARPGQGHPQLTVAPFSGTNLRAYAQHSSTLAAYASAQITSPAWVAEGARNFPAITGPFAQVRTALEAGTVYSLEDLLAIIPDCLFETSPSSAPWPETLLRELLSRPADQESIIRLLPVMQRFIEAEPVASGAQISRVLIGRMRITRTLAALPSVMDMIVARLHGSTTSGELDYNQSMSIIDELLVELRKFCFFSSIRDRSARLNQLPPPIDDMVVRLATLAITLSESRPLSSTADGSLDFAVRFRLFDSVLLSPAVRHELLTHLPHQSITPAEWRACVLSVIREAGPDTTLRARKYTGYLGEAEKRRLRNTADGVARTSSEPVLGGATEQIGFGGRGWKEDRVALEEMDRIILARCGTRTQSLIDVLSPYLYPKERLDDKELDLDDAEAATSDIPSTQFYAWSMVTHRLARSPHTSSLDLSDLAAELPDGLAVPHVITPIIQGLMRRGDLRQAWELFTDLVEKQQSCDKDGRYVDRALLAVVMPLYSRLFGFQAAPELLDKWARKVRWSTGAPSGSSLRSVTLDTVNLNALLLVCLQRDQPSTAFRLLAAAQPRWGIWPDAISLNIILDCCRQAKAYLGSGEDTIRSRLRELVHDMRLFGPEIDAGNGGAPASNMYSAYDMAGFASGDHRVLLDKPDSTWRDNMGAASPPALGRQLFRDIIFGNWPHLVHAKSPLDFSNPFINLNRVLRSSVPPPASGEVRHPLSTAQYTHIIPNAASFQSYIKLLAKHKLQDEIPLALAWMRELGIDPNWRSMCLALAYVCEAEGPRRLIRKWSEGRAELVRDEEILRRWLQHWVKGEVPTEEEVATYIRKLGERRANARAKKDV